MKTTSFGLLALVFAGVTMPVGAADDDLFHSTLFCHKKPTTAYASPLVTAAPCCPQPACPTCAPVAVSAAPACSTCAPAAPACNACAQPSCSTSYVQKSYYQAVTSYQTQTYYEPVTQYQTSYYYEPVTTYRTSYYYCPQSCSYKQSCAAETSYQLKTKSCPIQSYVARCQQVPVTTYQKAYYLEPQTTCCQTTVGAPVSASAVMPAPPQVSVTPSTPAPSTPPLPPIINEQRTPAAPSAPSYYPPNTPPATPNGASWQPAVPGPIQVTPAKQPTVKLEQIVFGSDQAVEGQVVRGDNTPRPNAKVLFVNANQSTLRETITANDAGRFVVSLASGGWLVYVYDLDNNAVFNSRIDVNNGPSAAKIILVNR